MAKKYVDINVYEATQKRLKYLFEEFDNILVAFSGGKDSGALLNLAYDYAKENDMINKLYMYHLDYEAQYQQTTDYVTDVFMNKFKGIKKMWLCLPVGADCGCKMDSDTWVPWEQSKKDLWVRDMPDNEYVINQFNCPFKMYEGEKDYEVQDNFGKWFASKYGKTAILIGIRSDESLNRFRAIKSDKKVKPYKNKNYINGYPDDDLAFKAYPIYDWQTRDIWIYNGKYEKEYNKLYDLYYQAGLNIDEMRVANPFHSCGEDNLKLYKVIDPNNWAKMVGRVNGVNFSALYGGTTAMGWKKITKPENMTWKQYCFFLLNTLDEKTRQHYLNILKTSIKVWVENGCVCDDETIKEMESIGIKFKNKGKKSKISNKDVCQFDEYPDDMPISNFRQVPSYKRMCVCIMKNDYTCKYMGFAPTKEFAKKRKETMKKWSDLL